MKKSISALILMCMIIGVLPGAVPTVCAAQNDEVLLTEHDSLENAISSVANGGTIRITGTYSIPSGFKWPSYSKAITITGGTLDATALGSAVNINGGVTFRTMSINFQSGAVLYANGHSVTIAEDVSVTGALSAAYGGGASGSSVNSTQLTLLSGSYSEIYGGSNGGTVVGDAHLTVGGNVNPYADYTSHSAVYSIYGGGNNDSVGGDVYLTFTGNAKANYVWGGSYGSKSVIGGDRYTVMSGGYTMSLYGGGKGSGAGGDSHTLISGGVLQQLFGGSEGACVNGDVDLRVMGGTVERRIYGGCYNEYEAFKWQSDYYVDGNITLTLGRQADITFSVSDSDRSIYAWSRQKSKADTGTVKIVFADSNAYSQYSGRLKAQDTTMQLIMLGVSAAEELHTHTYSADNETNTITESCDTCSHTATATARLTQSSYAFTGNEITPVEVIYSSDWMGYRPQVRYSDNVAPGNASATYSYECGQENINFTFSFEITELPASDDGSKVESEEGDTEAFLEKETESASNDTEHVEHEETDADNIDIVDSMGTQAGTETQAETGGCGSTVTLPTALLLITVSVACVVVEAMIKNSCRKKK